MYVKYPNLPELIKASRPLIFDFDYPIFDTNYKEHLETLFLRTYLFHEIIDTPVPRWKIYLQNKLYQEMPYLNKMWESEALKFNPLLNFDTHRQGQRDTTDNFNSNTTDDFNGEKNINVMGHRVDDGSTEDDNLTKRSDTPQSTVTDLLSDKYLTAAEKSDSTGSSKNQTDTTDSTSDEQIDKRTIKRVDDRGTLNNYLEHYSGYSGQSASSLLQEWRDSFINVDNMFIMRMRDLFWRIF